MTFVDFCLIAPIVVSGIRVLSAKYAAIYLSNHSETPSGWRLEKVGVNGYHVTMKKPYDTYLVLGSQILPGAPMLKPPDHCFDVERSTDTPFFKNYQSLVEDFSRKYTISSKPWKESCDITKVSKDDYCLRSGIGIQGIEAIGSSDRERFISSIDMDQRVKMLLYSTYTSMSAVILTQVFLG